MDCVEARKKHGQEVQGYNSNFDFHFLISSHPVLLSARTNCDLCDLNVYMSGNFKINSELMVS